MLHILSNEYVQQNQEPPYREGWACRVRLASNLGMLDTLSWLMASTKNFMPLRSSSREKKASRHTGFSLPISCTGAGSGL